MTAPVLSILIPTIPGRREYLALLMNRLKPQLSNAVKAVILEDRSAQDGGATIGERRQRMLEYCDTPFLCFFDDDDLPSDDYCESLLGAINAGADVVGFRLNHYTDGALTGLTIHSLNCKRWHNELHEDGLFRYERTPNHLNPVRRELAIQVGFPSVVVGEDASYSNGLYEKFGATMHEVFVDKYLYDYLYRNRQPELVNPYDADGNLTLEGKRRIIKEGGSVLVGGRLCTKTEQL